ncbi:MAG: LysM peptidoglycan-binding domain-containing protein [Clostridiales bacterium]|nr:LysM peptidoglycan-binding domain-containing protein [Clostridiales bacterium]
MTGRTERCHNRYQTTISGQANKTAFRTDRRVTEKKNAGKKRDQANLDARDSHQKVHHSSSAYHSRIHHSHNSWDRRKIILFISLSLFLLSGGIGVCSVVMASGGSFVVEANQPLSDVKYKVVEIEYGDSLWSIAKDNMTPGFSDIYEYIDEIKRCNQLNSDHITSGGYLMIPYYEDLSL